MKNSSWAYGCACALIMLMAALTALEVLELKAPSFHKWFFFGFAVLFYCTTLILETIENNHNQKPPSI